MQRARLGQRGGWVGLWAGGVLAVAMAAYPVQPFTGSFPIVLGAVAALAAPLLLLPPPRRRPPRASLGTAAQAARLVVALAALSPLVFTAWQAAFSCAYLRQQSVEPGQPQPPPECVARVSPAVALFVAPLLAALGGALWDRAWLAWCGAAPFLGLSLLFGLSMGFYIPFAAMLLVAVGLWDAVRRLPLGPARPAASNP
jgi:hypothetical protein